MEIMTCKKFNKLVMKQWNKAAKWQKRFTDSLSPPSTYGIRNKTGDLRKSGFVLFPPGYSWFKTKKEAVAKKEAIIKKKHREGLINWRGENK